MPNSKLAETYINKKPGATKQTKLAATTGDKKSFPSQKNLIYYRATPEKVPGNGWKGLYL